MRILQAVLLLGFLTMVSVFAVQNRGEVTLSFLSWNLAAPVALLTISVYILGMLSGWTVVSLMTSSFRRAIQPPRS